MKNVFLIPTNKPSRLSILNSGKLNLGTEAMSSSNSKLQHTYITFDEEIKEGDWFYNTISLNPEPFKACENGYGYVNCSKYSHYRMDCKKIILTTDPELIADGVEQILEDTLLKIVEHINSGENIESFDKL
jgi:hypothetical protein